MKDKMKSWYDGTKGPKKYEFILAALLLFVSAYFFCFYHDFYLTLNQSLTFDACLLNGKIIKFYSVINHQALNGVYSPEWPNTLLASANYTIINYATFGIVCLPFYIIGKLAHVAIPFVLYEAVIKTMYVAIDIYMAKVVKDICELLGFDEVKTKWTVLLFISSPILLFSSTMITHLDIFCVVFFLMGIRSMLKGNKRNELIFFMVAAAYKPFIILSIIPIILLKEKRILFLLRDLLVMVLGILVQSGVYRFDPGYAKSQKFMSKTYDFMGRFFATGIEFERNLYRDMASWFVISFCVICLLAYFVKNVKNYHLFAFPLMGWCVFVLFVQWHPNWLLLMVPFLVFAVAFTNHKKLMLLLQTALSTLVILVSALGWQGNYDNNIVNGGVVSKLMNWSAAPKYEIANILQGKLGSIPVALYGSALCAVVVCIVLVMVVDLWKPNVKSSDSLEWERGVIWLSICPIAGFALYSLAACILS